MRNAARNKALEKPLRYNHLQAVLIRGQRILPTKGEKCVCVGFCCRVRPSLENNTRFSNKALNKRPQALTK